MRLFTIENSQSAASNEETGQLDRPIRALFITSVRDVGNGSDRNGSLIDTPNGRKYMKGAVETCVDEVNACRELADHAQVIGVVYDDMHSELLRDGYPARPRFGQPWIYPTEKINSATGDRMIDNTFSVPSVFRSLPLTDQRNRDQLKLQFEAEIHELMRMLGADIIISDHLLMRIVNLIRRDAFDLYGRVLNIHPAITDENSPYRLRGLTPTQDAIGRTHGFRRDRRTSLQTPVERHFRTGSTLHFVSPEIDAGPVICDDEPTPVYPNDTPQLLRYRNYLMAKGPVLVEGLMHYHREMFGRILADHPELILTTPQHVSAAASSIGA